MLCGEASATARLPGDRSEAVRGHRIGKLVDWKDGIPLVDFPGNPFGSLSARLLDTVELDPATPLRDPPCEVLLVFEEERADLPVIVGTVKPLPRPLSKSEKKVAQDPGPMEAKIVGRRVTLTARDEIELRCGEAGIVLRRNGRVVIRGTYVETRSRGTNRIRGGTVEIN